MTDPNEQLKAAVTAYAQATRAIREAAPVTSLGAIVSPQPPPAPPLAPPQGGR